MELKHLVNEALFSEMKKIRSEEKKYYITSLEYIKEIDTRASYVELGYLSLYSYLTQELQYSKDEAYLRINAIKVIRRVPSVQEDLKNNTFTLSTLDYATRMTDMTKGKNSQERLESALEIVRGKSKGEAYQALQKLKDEQEDKKLTLMAQKRVMINLSKNEYDLLYQMERLKKKVAKEFLMEKINEEKRKIQKEIIKSSSGRTRHIPESLKRAIMIRAKFMCEEPGCYKTSGLEFAHKLAYSKGGGHTFDNIRLLCHAHHKYETHLEFGRREVVSTTPLYAQERV